MTVDYISCPPERTAVMRAGFLLLLHLILEVNHEQYITGRDSDDFRGIIALLPVEDVVEG